MQEHQNTRIRYDTEMRTIYAINFARQCITLGGVYTTGVKLLQ